MLKMTRGPRKCPSSCYCYAFSFLDVQYDSLNIFTASNCTGYEQNTLHMHLFPASRPLLRTTFTLVKALPRPRVSSLNAPFTHIQQHILSMSTKVAERLKGKTIVITGASSGIGRATAVEFARTQPDDLKLILTARREDALKEVAKEIEGFAKGVQVLPVKLDVSKPAEIESFVGNLPQEFKKIDVLVNNA